jgi:hypothetical protein
VYSFFFLVPVLKFVCGQNGDLWGLFWSVRSGLDEYRGQEAESFLRERAHLLFWLLLQVKMCLKIFLLWRSDIWPTCRFNNHIETLCTWPNLRCPIFAPQTNLDLRVGLLRSCRLVDSGLTQGTLTDRSDPSHLLRVLWPTRQQVAQMI